MKKTIKIGEKEFEFTATAATPLHYRNTFKGYDMLKELAGLSDGDITSIDYGMVDRMAYIMSGAFKEQGTMEEWLEQFEPLDIINAMTDILGLYTDNADTQNITRKNAETAETES